MPTWLVAVILLVAVIAAIIFLERLIGRRRQATSAVSSLPIAPPDRSRPIDPSGSMDAAPRLEPAPAPAATAAESVRNMVDGQKLAPTIAQLVLHILDSEVSVVRSADAREIGYSTNYPEHFTLDTGAGSIEQTASRQTWFARNAERLLVTVPLDFKGGLHLSAANSSTVNIDRWDGGDVEIDSESENAVTVGPVTGTRSLKVTLKGSGDANLGKVQTETFDFTLSSSGCLNGDDVTATGNGEAKTEDSGNIKVGIVRAADLNITQNGDGTFTSKDVILTGALDHESTGDGETTLGDITAKSAKLAARDDGDLTTGKIVCKGGEVVVETGLADGEASSEQLNASVKLDSIASISVTVTNNADGNLEVPNGMVVEGEVDIANQNAGATNVGPITAAQLTLDIQADGDINLGVATIGDQFKAESSGDGSLTTAALSCASMDAELNGDGGMTFNGETKVLKKCQVITKASGAASISNAFCAELYLETDSEGDGDIDVYAGNADRIFVVERGGSISVADSFRNVWKRDDE